MGKGITTRCIPLPLILLALCFPAAAASTAVQITPDLQKQKIGKSVSYLLDPRNSLTIRDFDGPAAPDGFVRSKSDAPGFGYTGSACWLSFSTENSSGREADLFLEIANPLLDTVRLYKREPGGFTLLGENGDHLPFSRREVRYRNPVFSVTIPPGTADFMLYVRTSSNMNLPLVLWNRASFAEQTAHESAFLWMFYGIMICIILYSLLVLVQSRDPIYGVYIAVIAGFLLFRFAYNGLAFQYLWPESVRWANSCIPFLISVFVAFLLQFTRMFLKTYLNAPVLDIILKWLTVPYLIGIPFSILGPYAYAIRAVLGVSLFTSILLIAAGIISMKKGVREATFYLIAWSTFFIGSALNILRDFGILPVTFITTWGQQIGTVSQALFLSIGLADRINTMKRDIDQAHGVLLKAHRKLDEERELLSVTLKSIDDAVVTIDLKGRIILFNRAAEAITGWDRSDAAGRPLAEVIILSDEKSGDPITIVPDSIDSKIAACEMSYEPVLVSKDGARKNIAFSRCPLHDRNSRMIGEVLVFRDITERLRTEKEILKASKLESLGAFAGGIAHDFNNILTVIIGNLSLIRLQKEGGGVDDQVLSDTEKITERAKGLTQQLLTFSRGGSPIKKATDLRDLLRDTASFIVSGSKTRIHFEIEDGLWGAEIDEGQISQAVNNLVINSIQSMPRGGTVTVSACNLISDGASVPGLQPGNFVKISVSDEGAGIPVDLTQKIFDPFFTTKPEGSGLGLSSTQSIVMKHGGRITVESTPGKGSLFTVYIPSLNRDAPSVKTRSKAPIKGKGRVLILDDEEMILKTAANLIRRLGYEADISSDGTETIEKYMAALRRNEPFDAVVMDLTIPGGLGGKETLEQLRELDANVRAIVSSGYSNDPVMSQYRSFGFIDIIEKPYTLTSISEVLHRVISSRPRT